MTSTRYQLTQVAFTAVYSISKDGLWVHPVFANPAVLLLQGHIAIQRGRLVYCLEGVDNGGTILDRISLDPQTISRTFTEEYRPALLGGVIVINDKGYAIDEAGRQDELYWEETPTEREVEITAVPYCVWDNRTPGCVPEIGTQNEHDSHHSESG